MQQVGINFCVKESINYIKNTSNFLQSITDYLT